MTLSNISFEVVFNIFCRDKIFTMDAKLKDFISSIRVDSSLWQFILQLTLEALRGGGVKLTPPLDFFGFKFLLLDRLSKALAQLFLVCEHIF